MNNKELLRTIYPITWQRRLYQSIQAWVDLFYWWKK